VIEGRWYLWISATSQASIKAGPHYAAKWLGYRPGSHTHTPTSHTHTPTSRTPQIQQNDANSSDDGAATHRPARYQSRAKDPEIGWDPHMFGPQGAKAQGPNSQGPTRPEGPKGPQAKKAQRAKRPPRAQAQRAHQPRHKCCRSRPSLYPPWTYNVKFGYCVLHVYMCWNLRHVFSHLLHVRVGWFGSLKPDYIWW